jgi:quercetin dioxygenase-like cupin family protein
MIKPNVSKLVESSSSGWMSAKIPGVQFIPLNTDAKQNSGTFLYRLSAGTIYPKHRHASGEEMFVLKGDLVVSPYNLKSGDYLFSPSGSTHELSTKSGCLFLLIIDKPVAVITGGAHEDRDVSAIEVAPGDEEPSPSIRELDPRTLQTETAPGTDSDPLGTNLKDLG